MTPEKFCRVEDQEVWSQAQELGREIAALLETERSAPGVMAGTRRPELKAMAAVSRVGGGPLNPDAGDLALTCGWGHGGKDGVTMPAKGRIVGSRRHDGPIGTRGLAQPALNTLRRGD